MHIYQFEGIRIEIGPEVYLVERFICNEEVGGPTPPGSTLRSNKNWSYGVAQPLK